MHKLLIALLTTLSLLGCAEPLHHFTISPREPGIAGQGVAYGYQKKVNITLNGITYIGTFILDTGKVTTLISNSTATARSNATVTSGTNIAYGTGFGRASGTTVGNLYEPGSGNGKLLATDGGGNSIRCEFTINLSLHGTGLGICQDNSGKSYDMVILD